MTDKAYKLRASGSLLVHGPKLPKLLRDQPDEITRTEIDALVASGDCLITLATGLDASTQFLTTNPEAARPQLEKTIRTLLYLQRNYQLKPKPSKHQSPTI